MLLVNKVQTTFFYDWFHLYGVDTGVRDTPAALPILFFFSFYSTNLKT